MSRGRGFTWPWLHNISLPAARSNGCCVESRFLKLFEFATGLSKASDKERVPRWLDRSPFSSSIIVTFAKYQILHWYPLVPGFLSFHPQRDHLVTHRIVNSQTWRTLEKRCSGNTRDCRETFTVCSSRSKVTLGRGHRVVRRCNGPPAVVPPRSGNSTYYAGNPLEVARFACGSPSGRHRGPLCFRELPRCLASVPRNGTPCSRVVTK